MHSKNKNCPLYKKGLYIERVNQSESIVSMCCHQKKSSLLYTTVDFHNNPYLREIRSTPDPHHCDPCFLTEAAGAQSYRIGQIKAFELNGIDLNDEEELISLLYNCENVCNLKCITCGPKFSSAWRPDYKKLNFPLKQNKQSTVKNKPYELLDLSKIRLLHFQGGEPLLTDDHENILKKIDKDGKLDQLVLSYNTNGTIFPSAETIDLWSKTKMTKLYFSIDGIGKQFEYIRYPAKWESAEKNMIKIRNLNIPTMWMEIGITVSIANLFYLQDIINWRDNYFSKLNNGDPIGIYVTFAGPIDEGGRLLSLENLPVRAKHKAIDYLKTLSDTTIGNSVINYLNNAQLKDEYHWQDYLENIDKLRAEDWKISLSRLYETTQ